MDSSINLFKTFEDPASISRHMMPPWNYGLSLTNAGHLLSMEQPERVDARIQEFLSAREET
jgi:pimeloyl-ACP methyl ester carboxylesterase